MYSMCQGIRFLMNLKNNMPETFITSNVGLIAFMER